jgi:bacterioferritin-associated ferredoxin
MYVCLCGDVTEDKIKTAVDCGLTTLSEVIEHLGAGAGCGACHDEINEMLCKVKNA